MKPNEPNQDVTVGQITFFYSPRKGVWIGPGMIVAAVEHKARIAAKQMNEAIRGIK